MQHDPQKLTGDATEQAPGPGEVLFAKQPVFDTGKAVAAYELLFRGDFQRTSAEAATATVFSNAFAENLFYAATEHPPVLVNFPEQLLSEQPPFTPDKLIIEVLEDVSPSEDVIAALRALKAQGFRLALDDFVFVEELRPLLELADIIKIDVLLTPAPELPELVARLADYPATLLAEKVETYEQYQQCLGLGFELFQGYFFARPELVSGTRMTPDKSSTLGLINALQDPAIDPPALEAIIKADPGLSYKVLQLANSVENRRAVAIDSIRQAIAMLGLYKLKNFSTLIALTSLEGKPEELQRYTQTYALLCERIGSAATTTIAGDSFYLAGLLTCCEAYFDTPIDRLLESIPVADDIRSALLDGSGLLGAVLSTARAYQEGRWNELDWPALVDTGLCQETCDRAFLEATAQIDSDANQQALF
ncbi:MAG: HDOD domain-containing protein [Pseudomonadota bacterium]